MPKVRRLRQIFPACEILGFCYAVLTYRTLAISWACSLISVAAISKRRPMLGLRKHGAVNYPGRAIGVGFRCMIRDNNRGSSACQVRGPSRLGPPSALLKRSATSSSGKASEISSDFPRSSRFEVRESTSSRFSSSFPILYAEYAPPARSRKCSSSSEIRIRPVVTSASFSSTPRRSIRSAFFRSSKASLSRSRSI
jgi:hypothetical protein